MWMIPDWGEGLQSMVLERRLGCITLRFVATRPWKTIQEGRHQYTRKLAMLNTHVHTLQMTRITFQTHVLTTNIF